MSIFRDWLERRKLKEELNDGGEPVDSFKFNTDDQDYADDHEHLEQELFKAVMSKYPEEAEEFLNGIAQRGDEEIANLLRKLRKDQPMQMKEPQHPTDGDEVVPPGADTGYNAEFGND